MKKIVSLFLLFLFLPFSFSATTSVKAEEEKKKVPITADAAVLMEMKNGTVLFEKNSETQKKIASVTKIMTILLIMEEIDQGRMKLTDLVTVSEHAASMGGSQVFLEPYETQTVEDLLKCICISSANDASVAMAEHIAGSEDAFVERMNQRAAELSMKQTTFVNCCGLDIEGHLSCARDVAIMSAELLIHHPSVQKYTTTWMDTITHTTKRGDTSFGLSNTNKLIKQYSGITGLKTGSTSEAKYCLSATAERNGVSLVAVVLAAPDTKTRFREAAALLDYGFARSVLYQEETNDLPPDLIVKGGQKKRVSISLSEPFSYIFVNGESSKDITREFIPKDSVTAPLKAGENVGEYVYSLKGKVLKRIPVLASEDVAKQTMFSGVKKCTSFFFQR